MGQIGEPVRETERPEPMTVPLDPTKVPEPVKEPEKVPA